MGFRHGFHDGDATYKPQITKIEFQALDIVDIVKHTTTGLWSSGNMLYGVMNHVSLFGNQMGESEFGRCWEKHLHCYPKLSPWLDCGNCVDWWSGGKGVELIFRVWAWPLTYNEGQSLCFSKRIPFGLHYASNFVDTFWGRPFSFPACLCPNAQRMVHKDLVGSVECKELDWSAQSLDQSLIKHPEWTWTIISDCLKKCTREWIFRQKRLTRRVKAV